jgi:hypothetical protein
MVRFKGGNEGGDGDGNRPHKRDARLACPVASLTATSFGRPSERERERETHRRRSTTHNMRL